MAESLGLEMSRRESSSTVLRRGLRSKEQSCCLVANSSEIYRILIISRPQKWGLEASIDNEDDDNGDIEDDDADDNDDEDDDVIVDGADGQTHGEAVRGGIT